jgi:hypothetical protein
LVAIVNKFINNWWLEEKAAAFGFLVDLKVKKINQIFRIPWNKTVKLPKKWEFSHASFVGIFSSFFSVDG